MRRQDETVVKGHVGFLYISCLREIIDFIFVQLLGFSFSPSATFNPPYPLPPTGPHESPWGPIGPYEVPIRPYAFPMAVSPYGP